MKDIALPRTETSYWIQNRTQRTYPVLSGHIKVDVAVIGGGIAGFSAAYFLKKAGKTVAVLEGQTIGSRVTGNTTGKVTSQHGLCYADMQHRFGDTTARLYGEANQTAIEQMEEIITKESIDCDWERDDNYVFSEDEQDVTKLQKEATVAATLGLPASFETTTSLPFAVAGAVKFGNQAKFHSRQYVLGLARVINGDGSYVFEGTKASPPSDGTPCIVSTKHGSVTASDVVIATNVPFPYTAHGYYGAYEYPLKSYIVAGTLPKSKTLSGMYITPSNGPIRSILPITAEGKDMLLIGGESHFPGFGHAATRHRRLAEYAKEKFGLETIDYRWSTWDYLSNDDIPLIGKLYPWSKHVYTATGFMKWGLSTGTVAGMILRDTILGKENPWANVYDSTRVSPVTSLPRAVGKIIKHL